MQLWHEAACLPACSNSSLFRAAGLPGQDHHLQKETYLSCLTHKKSTSHSTILSLRSRSRALLAFRGRVQCTGVKRRRLKADDDRGATRQSESSRWLSQSGGPRNTNASLPWIPTLQPHQPQSDFGREGAATSAIHPSHHKRKVRGKSEASKQQAGPIFFCTWWEQKLIPFWGH